LTSKKTSSISTIFLEPGTYVMECYVRMPNGMPHTFMGMVKELKVSEETNGMIAPKADFNIDIASTKGITFIDSLKTGTYIFSAKFQDQKLYEHMMGHDVNLVKIENDSLISNLGDWLNTVDFNAFRSPVPEGLLFLGGVEDLPAGKTGYFEQSFTSINQIKSNLINLIMTSKGERVFQPEFGSDLHSLIFTQMDEEYEAAVQTAIQR